MLRRALLPPAAALLLGVLLASPATAAPAEYETLSAFTTFKVRADSGTVKDGVIRNAKGITVTVTKAEPGTPVVTRTAKLPACRFGCAPRGVVGATELQVLDPFGGIDFVAFVTRSDGTSVCCTRETSVVPSNPAIPVRSYRLGMNLTVAGRHLSGQDVRFYQRFGPRALGVYLPVRVWGFDERYVAQDVTKQRLDLVEQHRKALEAEIDIWSRAGGSRTAILKVIVPAWAAEMRLLGRRKAADARIAKLVRSKKLTAAFVKDLRRYLDKTGY